MTWEPKNKLDDKDVDVSDNDDKDKEGIISSFPHRACHHPCHLRQRR